MTDASELVRLEVIARGADTTVATITLDSPANRNALSRALLEQLRERLDEADQEPGVRAVVLAAEGPVFCAGADMMEAVRDGMEQGARAMLALQRQLLALSKPVAARVHGPVRAGGLGIVSACDVAIAARSVSFAFTEVRLGLAPAVISLPTLARLTPRAASETFLGGETFDAPEAARIGLITRAVPDADLDAAVAAVVAAWCQGSTQGLRETKALLNASLLERFATSGDHLAALSARLFGSPEARAAMNAFLHPRA